MAEDKTRKPALDLGSLATGGTQEAELNDEQLDEVSGGHATIYENRETGHT